MRPLSTDDIWPRIPDYRYRLYAVKNGERKVLGAVPDPEGLGRMLIALHEDARAHGAELGDEGALGVLDVLAHGPERNGAWIIRPWGLR